MRRQLRRAGALIVVVLVLQHPNEHRKKNVSTVPLMPLVLRHFTKKVGYTFGEDVIPEEFQSSAGGGGGAETVAVVSWTGRGVP